MSLSPTEQGTGSLRQRTHPGYEVTAGIHIYTCGTSVPLNQPLKELI